jgi:hypothetical protein
MEGKNGKFTRKKRNALVLLPATESLDCGSVLNDRMYPIGDI